MQVKEAVKSCLDSSTYAIMEVSWLNFARIPINNR